MKAKVSIPRHFWGPSLGSTKAEGCQVFIDEVLLWGMELDIQVEHYLTQRVHDNVRLSDIVATFTIEEKDSFFFVMKWGALMKHKPKVRNTVNE